MKCVCKSSVSAITQTPASGPFVLFTTPLIMPSGSARGAAFASVNVAAASSAAAVCAMTDRLGKRFLLFMRILRIVLVFVSCVGRAAAQTSMISRHCAMLCSGSRPGVGRHSWLK